jgi:outer membrane protein assembly factor BamA
MRNKGSVSRRAIALLALVMGAAALWAQEAPFVIRGVDFEVKGRTIGFVLRQKIEDDGPVAGRKFADREALEAFIAEKKQILVNNRVLASVESSYDETPNEGGWVDVDLHFAVVDTWNLIALPQPKYDSNSGLTLYVKGRDYNFAGSMQTLTLDFSYVSDTASNKSIELSTSFTLPFRAMSLEWTLGLSQDLQYWTDTTLRSGSSASLGLAIPGLGFPANVSFTQGFSYNVDKPDYEPDPYFLSESFSLSASIPTGIELGSLGELSFSPSLGLSRNWWPSTDLTYAGRAGTIASFANGFSVGRSDWTGNMRKGTTISLSGSQAYNISFDSISVDLSGTLSAYRNWFDRRLGMVARLTVVDRIVGDRYALGGYLRGIIDERLYGVGGVFANFSVPVKLFDFPTHLLIKKNWLDFECQAQPFLDVAAVAPNRGVTTSTSWIWAAGGLEVLVFPVIMRSFIVRASIGFDLRNVLRTRSLTATASDGYRPYEIYFGTGLFL